MNHVDVANGSSHQYDDNLKSTRRQAAKNRESDFAGISSKQLARLLLYQQRETRDLERVLGDVSRQVHLEAARADDNEHRAREAALRFRAIDDGRRLAEQEVKRAKEELRLYQQQLAQAQAEIDRAQKILEAIETQRSDAEQAAASARSTARRLREERLMDMAREEGRRQGLREGLERGRYAGYAEGRFRTMEEIGADQEEEEEEEEDISPGTYESLGGPIRTFGDTPLVSATTETGPDIPAPVPPPPPDDGQIHPVIMHNYPRSPGHTPVDMPPEGWIPNMDNDGQIRLPPAHEFEGRYPPPTATPATTASPTLTSPIDIEDIRPVRIVHAAPPSAPPTTTSFRTRPRRGSSPDSSTSRSTNLSKMDLVTPPETDAGGSRLRDRGIPRGRGERELSVIPEASPAPEANRKPSLQTFTPAMQAAPVPLYENGGMSSGVTDGRRTPARPPSATPTIGNTLRPPLEPSNRSFRSSTSSAVNITVQPPSRPPSNTSRRTTMVGFLSPESAHSPLPAVPEPSDPNYLAEDNVAPFIPPAPGTGSESYAMPSTAGPPSYAAPPVGVPYPGSSSSGSAPYVPSGSAPQPQPMFGGLPPGFMPTGLPAGFVPMAPPLSAEQYAQTPGAVPVQIAPQPPITVGNAMVNQPRTANAPSRPPSAPVIPRAPSVPSVMRVDPGAGAPMPGSFEIEPATSGMPSNPSNSAPVPAPAPTAMPVPAPSVVPVPPPGVYSDRSRGSARRAPVNIYGGRGTPAIQTELSRNIPTPESSEPDDEISSSLGSLDTLTTPPQRPKHMAGATPRYEEAPLPSGVSYPQPGRPASSRSARTRTSSGGTTSSATAAAARVPLPPSTVGWSPRTASSPYGSSWGTISTNMNAGATPAPLNRPFSIFSDAPKGGGDRDSLRGSRFGSDAGSEFNDDLLVRSNNHNPIPVPPPGVVTRAPSGSASVRERIERLGTILDSPHQTKRKPQGRYAASVESVSDD